jgi:hypothetical protein
MPDAGEALFGYLLLVLAAPVRALHLDRRGWHERLDHAAQDRAAHNTITKRGQGRSLSWRGINSLNDLRALIMHLAVNHSIIPAEMSIEG